MRSPNVTCLLGYNANVGSAIKAGDFEFKSCLYLSFKKLKNSTY